MKVVHPGRPGQAVGCDTVSVDREIARMNMHENARLTPQGQLLLVQRVTDQGWTVGSAAGAAGLSERQAYRWLARYRAGGTAALSDRSSAPKHCRHEVPAARVAEIEHQRRQRLSGPAIARQLVMPVSTVGSVLRRLGLGKLAALEPRPPVVRYQRERPGELIHVDTKKLGRIEAVGHRITGDRRDPRRGAGREAVHVCIDDASRLAYSEVLADERKPARCRSSSARSPGSAPRARRAWPTSVVGPGGRARVELVMTDNGSAYRSDHWRHACGALELRHVRTRGAPGRPPRAALGASRAYTPRTNGKAERFIQTSLREWAYARPHATSHGAPPRSSPGSTTTTPPGRTLPWPISRRPAASANRRSLVRSTAPFLRPDLPSPTTGPPGRRQERHRRPAPAGAQRPCTDPPDRSRSNRRKPNARSHEQRSWKRQLAYSGRPSPGGVREEADHLGRGVGTSRVGVGAGSLPP